MIIPLAHGPIFVSIVFLIAGPVATHGQDGPQLLEQLLNSSHDLVSEASDAEESIGLPRVAQAPSTQEPGPGPAVDSDTAPAATLPNGASSISENYGDWSVDCAIQDDAKVCAMSQARGNGQTGQHVFAMELRAPQDGNTDGVLVLPFGLNIQAPVNLAIDDQPLGQGAVFSTCVPAGCIVPISFPEIAVDALRAGTTLTVTAMQLTGQDDTVAFEISLAGFTAATSRIAQLAN